MEFSLDMNIKLGEKNHKHVAIVSIREPESGEYRRRFTVTVSLVVDGSRAHSVCTARD